MIASALLLRHIPPKAAAVSYSPRLVPAGYLYSPTPSLRLPRQATGQCQQPCRFVTLALKISLLKPETSGSSTTPTPPQFFTGESPLCAEASVCDQVPKLCKPLRAGA